jgi:2-polyprenyl-6-methoxyphenol hydroxylase-like FAD-dependent oxidoreductase
MGSAIDVLWFRLPREPGDPEVPLGRFYGGRLLVMFNRTDSWQVGYLVPKGGGLQDVYDRGIDWFRSDVAAHTPLPPERAEVIRSWDDVPLLTVMLQRLRKWYRPGVLCIGDAAHAMSPIAGVGINLAVHDAVAAANELAIPLRDGTPITTRQLRKIQWRRKPPITATQWMQSMFQDRVVTPTLRRVGEDKPLGFLKVYNRYPALTHIPGLLIGRGLLPEHVSSPLRGSVPAARVTTPTA